MFTTISHYLKVLTFAGLFFTSPGLLNIAHAVPMFYTFSGTVDSSNDDVLAASYGLGIGASVSYTFMIDLDLAGSVTQNGVTTNHSDIPGTVDYFFVDYVGGSENPEAYRSYNEFNLGETRPGSNSDYLTGGNNLLLIDLNDRSVHEWLLGDLFLFTDFWTLDLIDYDVIGFATLSGISDTNPHASVPEPAGLLLLAAGLLGVGFTRRRT